MEGRHRRGFRFERLDRITLPIRSVDYVKMAIVGQWREIRNRHFLFTLSSPRVAGPPLHGCSFVFRRNNEHDFQRLLNTLE